MNIGLLFNIDTEGYKKVAHTFLLCFTITSGQFFTASKLNFRALPQSLKDDYNNYKKSKKEQRAQSSSPAQPGAEGAAPVQPRKSMVRSISKFDYTAFIRKYMPSVCIWICRICSFTIAYAYNEYAGFVVLSWVLLSFILKLEIFAKWSKRIYLPLFIAAFFYEYVINIQALFKTAPGIFEDIPRMKEYTGGEKIPTPINPVEIGGFVVNIILMIVLTRY